MTREDHKLFEACWATASQAGLGVDETIVLARELYGVADARPAIAAPSISTGDPVLDEALEAATPTEREAAAVLPILANRRDSAGDAARLALRAACTRFVADNMAVAANDLDICARALYRETLRVWLTCAPRFKEIWFAPAP